jgi:hypothetical protein
VVDVPSVDNLQPEFTKAHGAATFDGLTTLDSGDPHRVVAWVDGDEVLDLSTIVLNSEHPEETAVLVQLWKTVQADSIQHR